MFCKHQWKWNENKKLSFFFGAPKELMSLIWRRIFFGQFQRRSALFLVDTNYLQWAKAKSPYLELTAKKSILFTIKYVFYFVNISIDWFWRAPNINILVKTIRYCKNRSKSKILYGVILYRKCRKLFKIYDFL